MTDKQRLDWLFGGNQSTGTFKWDRFLGAYYSSQKYRAPRQAIDAAIKVEKAEKAGGKR